MHGFLRDNESVRPIFRYRRDIGELRDAPDSSLHHPGADTGEGQTNGALCFIGKKTVSCHAIPKDAAQLIVDDSREKNYGLIVVGVKDVAVLDPNGDVDRIFRQHLAVKNLDLAKPVEEVLQQGVLQMTPFFPESYEAELMARIPSCTSGRWHPEFTDITAKGYHCQAGG